MSRDRGRNGRPGAKPHTRTVTIVLTEADAQVLTELAQMMEIDLVRLVRELAEQRAITERVDRRERLDTAPAMRLIDELYR